jgi:hypothetical protein
MEDNYRVSIVREFFLAHLIESILRISYSQSYR